MTNPFKNITPYIVGLIFVTVSFYTVFNRGSMPAMNIVLEKLILGIAFPTAILGLSLGGVIPVALYYLLIFIFEFAYGFLVGWLVLYLFRKVFI